MAAVDVKLSIALEAPFVGWNQARPLVDGDPVLAWARRERGEAVSTVAATGLVLVDPYENTGETDGEEREPAPIADAPDGEPDGELSYGQLVELTAELAAEREAEAAA